MGKFSNFFKRGAAQLKAVTAGETRIRSTHPENASTPSAALRIATVYRCVSLISESVANLPLIIERRNGRVFSRVEEGLLPYLLTVEPNEWTNAYDFWRQAVQSRLLYGDAYIVPVRDYQDKIQRLVLARPGTAAPLFYSGGYRIDDPEQGVTGEFEENQVIRLKGLTLDGVNTLSVIQYAAMATSIAATADRNTQRTFANGGATMGIVTNESGAAGYGEYQLEALQDLAARLSEGMRYGDRILAMGGKAGYIPIGMTAADMQALETRKFTVREICRFFGVHPSFVFDDTSNNYKSAEMANAAFLSNTLNPILRQIETEVVRKLLPGRSDMRIRFDREELYSVDLESRMSYIEKRIQCGTLTPNEAREGLGLLPVNGGDQPMITANVKPLNEIVNEGNKGNP